MWKRGYAFRREDNLGMHARVIHNKIKEFNCETCGKRIEQDSVALEQDVKKGLHQIWNVQIEHYSFYSITSIAELIQQLAGNLKMHLKIRLSQK